MGTAGILKPINAARLTAVSTTRRRTRPSARASCFPLGAADHRREPRAAVLLQSTLHNDSVAVIASFDERGQVLALIDGMNQVCKLAKRFLRLTLTAGVGSLCESLADLHFSAEGARSALDYRVLMGSGRAIYIDDVEPDPTAQLPFDEQDKRDLLAAIKLGTPENIRHAVDRCVGRFKEARLPIGQYQLCLMEMMAELLKVIRTYQLDASKVFGRDFDNGFALTSFDSLDELGRRLTEMCLTISTMIRRERTNSSKEIAESAKQFISENYQSPDISVEMLCDHCTSPRLLLHPL
ncbi:MAG: hypothetical protein ACLVL7_10390 [Anaerotruncus massiliensis (ex Togo et al. 2019)]